MFNSDTSSTETYATYIIHNTARTLQRLQYNMISYNNNNIYTLLSEQSDNSCCLQY